MINISLCMIVKDEEEIIERCLSSVKDVVDEIIIVDTGSTDSTKQIARKFTDKIYDFKWEEDFAKARNFSFSKASKDYILWMDADEYFDEENSSKLINLKKNVCNGVDAITLETKMLVCEQNSLTFIGRRVRIIKKSENFKWIGFVHEYIDVRGDVYDSDISIIHHKVKAVSNRNLMLYKMNIEKGKELSERDLYYYGKELYCNKDYRECINILKEFIDKEILVEEMLEALCKIGKSYLNLGNYRNGRKYFYQCFEYDIPNLDILYNIAESFELQNQYEIAICWYEMIVTLDHKNYVSFKNKECLYFNVNLSLCVCNYEIGYINKAYEYHLKCKEINPNNPCVIKNDIIFNNTLIDN